MSEEFALPQCCLDLDIDPMFLFFPDKMDEDGREFVEAHGLDGATWRQLRSGAIEMGNGKVKIKHRCQKLLDNGRCGIQVEKGYDAKPKMCRDFECRTRSDCACHGSGKPWQPIVVE